jgi:hypothetical protein
VRAGPAAVVRLEGALALAHGRLSWSTAAAEPTASDLYVGCGRWCDVAATPARADGRPWTARGPPARARLIPGYAAAGQRVKPGCPSSSRCSLAR